MDKDVKQLVQAMIHFICESNNIDQIDAWWSIDKQLKDTTGNKRVTAFKKLEAILKEEE